MGRVNMPPTLLPPISCRFTSIVDWRASFTVMLPSAFTGIFKYIAVPVGAVPGLDAVTPGIRPNIAKEMMDRLWAVSARARTFIF